MHGILGPSLAQMLPCSFQLMVLSYTQTSLLRLGCLFGSFTTSRPICGILRHSLSWLPSYLVPTNLPRSTRFFSPCSTMLPPSSERASLSLTLPLAELCRPVILLLSLTLLIV